MAICPYTDRCAEEFNGWEKIKDSILLLNRTFDMKLGQVDCKAVDKENARRFLVRYGEYLEGGLKEVKKQDAL